MELRFYREISSEKVNEELSPMKICRTLALLDRIINLIFMVLYSQEFHNAYINNPIH
jgi:hypothetical protein